MTEVRRDRRPTTAATPTPGPQNEAALIAQAQRDLRAFAPLYVTYFDAVYRYCFRCLADREAAADASQEVFVKAMAALPRYRAEAFRPWLFAIAHNVITDSYRRRGRRPAVAPLEAAAQRSDPDSGPEEAALAAESRRSLLALLATLPVHQREVVELRLADLTGQEIAAILGCSLGSVKIAQHRAYRRLRDLMTTAASAGGEGDDAH